ncbi:MAG TPA: PepSY domain-containing protein [Paracoccaceae bacterium]|nr:PepSY domain-containing protein [Paracoccaceae bacterium]
MKNVQKAGAGLAAATAALVVAGAVLGEEAVKPGLWLASTQEQIRAALTAQGFEVRKLDRDDGLTEVYAVKNGETHEFHVDPKTGVVAKVKADD